jgi:hypothetical protein
MVGMASNGMDLMDYKTSVVQFQFPIWSYWRVEKIQPLAEANNEIYIKEKKKNEASDAYALWGRKEYTCI